METLCICLLRLQLARFSSTLTEYMLAVLEVPPLHLSVSVTLAVDFDLSVCHCASLGHQNDDKHNSMCLNSNALVSACPSLAKN